MLRIECSCGKFLKVNETLIGKKIKCPACAAVQLVKRPAEESESNPEAQEREEHVAPAPKKKTPAGNGAAKSHVPPKSKSHGDDKKGEPHKKSVKKAGNNKMLLLIGGGVGAFVLFVGVLVGGYFMFFHKSSPPPVAKKVDVPKSEPVVKADPVAITLFVPHKKGDQREINVTADLKLDMKVDNAAELPPELLAEMPPKKIHNKIRMKAMLRTLEISDKGEETKVELTISQFDISELGDKLDGPGSAPVPSGTVAIGTLANNKFEWSSPSGSLPNGLANNLSAILLIRYMKEAESDIDLLFGTAEKQDVGGAWPINKVELTKIAKSQKLSGAPPSGKELAAEVKGSGKLVGLHEHEGNKVLDVDINLDVSQSDADSSFNLRGTVSARLPNDASTGPVKRVEKTDGKSLEKFEMDWGPDKTKVKVALKMVFSGTITTDTKFMENVPIYDRPTAKPAEALKFAAELRNIKVEWLSGQSAVKVSADYKPLAGTKPKPTADYTMYLQFDDGNGGKKSYVVEVLDGGDLQNLSAGKSITNPSLTITVPAKANTAMCNIVLKEKVAGNPKENELYSTAVAISGTPPNTAPAPVAEKLDIKLSNAKIIFGGKKATMNFSLDYAVASGKLDESKLYRVYVLFDGAKAKKGGVNAYEALGKQLKVKDTITRDFSATAGTDAKFTMWIVELPPGAKISDEKEVSQTISGAVTSTAAVKPQFQINVGLGQKMKNPANPKAPAQYFQLPISWTLSAGTINPQATYAFIMVEKGKQAPVGQPVPGAQFQPTGQTTAQLPFLGGNSFEIHIVEILGGQQTIVSNYAKGSIK